VPTCQAINYDNYGSDKSLTLKLTAGDSCQLIFPSGPGSSQVAELDLTFTYGSPIQVNAVDCPFGTTTSCNS
jgi:hypothetical protein